jgi:hypothetical protein
MVIGNPDDLFYGMIIVALIWSAAEAIMDYRWTKRNDEMRRRFDSGEISQQDLDIFYKTPFGPNWLYWPAGVERPFRELIRFSSIAMVCVAAAYFLTVLYGLGGLVRRLLPFLPT